MRTRCLGLGLSLSLPVSGPIRSLHPTVPSRRPRSHNRTSPPKISSPSHKRTIPAQRSTAQHSATSRITGPFSTSFPSFHRLSHAGAPPPTSPFDVTPPKRRTRATVHHRAAAQASPGWHAGYLAGYLAGWLATWWGSLRNLQALSTRRGESSAEEANGLVERGWLDRNKQTRHVRCFSDL